MLKMMRGAGGGGKGGGGGDFTQKPDNLRSADTFEGLLGLCAGPIKGPVRGLKSIRINGTQIEGENDEENFEGAVAVFADGDPMKFPQIADLKLGSAGAPVNVGVDISNTYPAGTPGPWVSRTLNNTNAEAIDLRFIVNQLYKQTKSGVFENVLHLEIEMKPSGTATWINPFASNGNTTPDYNLIGYDTTGKDSGPLKVMATMAAMDRHTVGRSTADGIYLAVAGKTSSPYVTELRVKVPNQGVYANRTWDVRVRLREPESIDADPNFEKRLVSWESMAAVYAGRLGEHEDWRALAWLQIYGKASDNFNGLPAIDGIYDTKIVSVPPFAVYNPDTRVYTGATWDGSWTKAYTNDPAWVIYDLVTDNISGLAAFVPTATLNKWDALELSKWCSTQVPDGKGGLHPRFSLNIYIDQSQRSDELVRFLAGSCGATAWDNGNGEWRVRVDKPQIPAAIFTHENIEGEFAYSHTDVDTRFNEVTVVFLNEEFDYREDWIRVQHDADIAKHGRRPTRLVAVGCTNRQQALRWAVQRIRTNLNEFRMVTFTTNRQGKYLERFDHILVADGSLNEVGDSEVRRTTGRIVDKIGSMVEVRDPIRLEVGVNYKLRTTMPNPDYNPEPTAEPTDPTWSQPTITVTRDILNDAGQRGDVTELYLDSPFPDTVAENANVALEAVGLPSIPRVYRVLDIDYNSDNEHISIAAIEVDTGKWAAADEATDDNLQQVLDDTVPPVVLPVGGMFTLSTFTGEFGIKRMLIANWERPDSASFDKYRLEYRFNQGPWQDMGYQRDDFWELAEPQVGRHELRVYAVARRGFESLPTGDNIAVPDLPSSLAVSYGPSAVTALYDYTGATPQDLPKDLLYKLQANGIELAEVSWDYRVTDGSVNGLTPASGWHALPQEGGIGTLTLTSVEVTDSQVEVRGTAAAGGSASEAVAVTRALADPPASAGVGATQSSGFNVINTPGSSFQPVTADLDVSIGAGKTQANINISLAPLMSKLSDNDGPWDIEYKVQRLVGGVWTDVGALQHSSPDPYIDYLATGTGGGGGGLIP